MTYFIWNILKNTVVKIILRSGKVVFILHTNMKIFGKNLNRRLKFGKKYDSSERLLRQITVDVPNCYV